MRKSISVFLTILLCMAAFTVSVLAFGPSDLEIPDSAEAIVYGQSGAGRNLMAYRFGTGNNVMVLGFAIHGYEDNWSRDGGALVYTAGELMKDLDANMDLVNNYDWIRMESGTTCVPAGPWSPDGMMWTASSTILRTAAS